MTSRVIAAAVALTLSAVASADEWKMSVTPYLWATDVGIDLTVKDFELVDETIPFEDLLEDLETVAQVRFEAVRGEHGLAIDLFDVNLADDNDRMPLPDGSGGELVLDTQIGMTILDVAGVYDPEGDGNGLAFIYGARVINQREEIDAEIELGGESGGTTSYDADDTFVDGLIGVRYVKQLPGRFSYEMAADVSTGDTQLTWSVAPTIGYTFGTRDQYRLTAGYRKMVVDFNTAESVDMDMTLSGFLVGFRFAF
jgi:hypothetical protein